MYGDDVIAMYWRRGALLPGAGHAAGAGRGHHANYGHQRMYAVIFCSSMK